MLKKGSTLLHYRSYIWLIGDALLWPAGSCSCASDAVVCPLVGLARRLVLKKAPKRTSSYYRYVLRPQTVLETWDIQQKKLQDSKLRSSLAYWRRAPSLQSLLHPSISVSFQSCNKLPSPFLAHRNGFSLSPLQWRHYSLLFSGMSYCTAGRSKDRDIPHCCRLLPADINNLSSSNGGFHVSLSSPPGNPDSGAINPINPVLKNQTKQTK